MSWKETMVFFLPFPSRTTWRKTEGQSCRMSIIPALSSQRGHVGKICLAELHFGTWFGDLISLWRPLYDRLRPLEHELFFGYSLQSDTIWHPQSLGKILFFTQVISPFFVYPIGLSVPFILHQWEWVKTWNLSSYPTRGADVTWYKQQ